MVKSFPTFSEKTFYQSFYCTRLFNIVLGFNLCNVHCKMYNGTCTYNVHVNYNVQYKLFYTIQNLFYKKKI